ncbi:MAG: chemotaxis protein CheW [Myxococcota bacterium]|nr:chemotaxis protein CheW [Myxococcota bacterium]
MIEANAGEVKRLLTFEVGGSLYGLPIAAVAEVSEVGRVAAVPTLPLRVAGVMNHHGDALPVVAREALFEVDAELPAPQHVLVLADDPEDPERFGVPVDAVAGLLEGAGGRALGADAVVERRPVEGRILSVLDPVRLRARALEMIERQAGDSPPMPGGE